MAAAFPDGAGRTCLLLGSRPDPVIPPAGSFDALACANASGHAARKLGLPDPDLTLISAVVGSGKPEDRHTLEALAGLATRHLFVLPRPQPGPVARRARWLASNWRLTTPWLTLQLRKVGYRWQHLHCLPTRDYDDGLLALAGADPALAAQVGAKRPSTGLAALGLVLGRCGFARCIMAGFDFTLRHAYGDSPLVASRGEVRSRHADTDIAILRALAARGAPVLTTETAVREAAGIVML